jgi:hypothetical protein
MEPWFWLELADRIKTLRCSDTLPYAIPDPLRNDPEFLKALFKINPKYIKCIGPVAKQNPDIWDYYIELYSVKHLNQYWGTRLPEALYSNKAAILEWSKYESWVSKEVIASWSDPSWIYDAFPGSQLHNPNAFIEKPEQVQFWLNEMFKSYLYNRDHFNWAVDHMNWSALTESQWQSVIKFRMRREDKKKMYDLKRWSKHNNSALLNI